MNQRDLQELEQAARAIVAVVERNRVSDETAAERRAKFVLLPGGSNSQEQEESISENSAVIFDEKEILKMPPEFRNIFKTQGVTAHVRMKGTTLYPYNYGNYIHRRSFLFLNKPKRNRFEFASHDTTNRNGGT